MARIASLLFPLLALFGTSACIDPMSPGSFIEDPRVLGAAVSVDGDPSRATPAPGESATVRFFVATPTDDTSTFGWAFVPCVRSPASLSVPVCQGAPAITDITMGTGAEPTARVTVPSAEALAGAKQMIVTGIVCANGTPTIDGPNMAPGCSPSTTKSQPLFLTIGIATDEPSTNENPVASDLTTTFDGAEWTAPATTPVTGCRSASGVANLPFVREGDELGITIDFAGVLRESYEKTIAGDPPLVRTQLEVLQLSHFSTNDGMERQFSIIDENSTSTFAKVKWKAHNADFDVSGTRVDFFFVLRDDRGGVDWIARSVCVVPIE
jgi:hypothetical protein